MYVVCLSAPGHAIAQDAAKAHRETKRPVTVADAIRMTQLGEPSYLAGGSSKGLVAHYSPNGKRFIVILKKGNPEDNTNLYSLLVFETAEVSRSPRPAVLLSKSSSSNREAIKDLKWLDDNETVAFIGENPKETPQVYTFNIRTKNLEKLTEHPTAIVSYDISRDGLELIYKADPPIKKVIDSEQARRDGIVLINQQLYELMEGDCHSDPNLTEGEQVFLQIEGRPVNRIPIGDVVFDFHPMSLSPDGRFALLKVLVRDVPQSWLSYQDRLLHQFASEKPRMGAPSRLARYILLDTKMGEAKPLLNVPSEIHKDAFAWAPDSQSIVLSGTYLPLDVTDPVERQAREKNTYVVEVKLPSRDFVKISDKDLRLAKWDQQTNTVSLESGYWWKSIPSMAYKKDGLTWKEVVAGVGDTDREGLPEVTLVEDAENPPKIYALDRKTQEQSLLLDPNPQFDQLRFGNVEAISWKATDGHVVQGGLYLPPDYVTGKRYPLVIQTHGFMKNRFRIDGPWSSAFAAQPLVGKGFVVIQVGGSKNHDEDVRVVGTPQEAPREMASYEGVINNLYNKGLIDRNKVGIIGFSRTVYTVKYTLTHSKYAFAAATVADGVGGGYFEYVAYSDVSQEYDALIGGAPFGGGLKLWLKNSPSFNLDLVRAPVRIEAFGPATLLAGWEWYSGLSRLEKPVDFVYIPGGTHLLVKPWDRMVSQQGNVDWFSFWLKDEEDPDPAKRQQYERWRHLRDLKR